MNVFALSWVLALFPSAQSGLPAARADRTEPRPLASTPEPRPVEFAILNRPAGRINFRPVPRACGSHPFAARPSVAGVAEGPIAGLGRRVGRPAILGRNPVLRC